MNKITFFSTIVVLCLFLVLNGLFVGCKSITSTATVTNQTTETILITTSTPTETVVTGISAEQAIALAAAKFPTSVILQSKIGAKLEPPQYAEFNDVWDVSFDGFTITGDALLPFGWVASEFSNFPTSQDLHVADIKIDSGSGIVVWKGASFIRLGGPATTVS